MKKRILIIKHGALGDFVLTLGLFKDLRQMHPDDHITLLTMSPFVKIGQQSGIFDDVLVDNRPKYNIFEWYRVCKKILIDGNFDIIYDLQQSRRTLKKYMRIVRFLSPRNICWALPYSNKQFNIIKKRPFSLGRKTETQLFFKRPFSAPDLSFCHGEGKYFSELPKDFILLIPGCSPNHPYKRWSAENYAAIAKKAAEQGIYSVVLGTQDEKQAIDTICAATDKAISFMNKSSLMDIPQIVLKSKLVIGNDTGPAHMASLCGKSTIVLFCDKTKKSANNLPNVTNLIAPNINQISVDSVWKLTQSLLDKE